MSRLSEQDMAIVTAACGGSERMAARVLAAFGGTTPTRLTPDDKAQIRRLIAGFQTGVRDLDAGDTGKGIRHYFHLVDVAARWLRMAERR